ncbi:hypothetical protein J4E83_009377 [Alternaria metachromatica]|uniref:uncharacterized protein n=1 Tax=Alternaria metachromatica TaxID=283354 RepID=UPI0020C4E2A3|nr:uncharacterized protein J4E83_009377 [Alternaria metachromatica]KAI4607834.1 hypothetical protein J4E83_009377 [Alternaria metachromatica]
MAHECGPRWRGRIVKNARSGVTLVAKLGTESATCTLPQDLATGGSDKIGKQVDDAGNAPCVVTLHGYDYIVVEMMVQHILDDEYQLDDTQELANYQLTHLKKAQPGIEDNSITVRVEGPLAELHVKVYLCAKEMEMPELLHIARRNIRNSLLTDSPTAEQFINILEKHKLYEPSEHIEEKLLNVVAACGALHRPRWLQEGGTKYLEFLGNLGTSRYAKYEAAAERDWTVHNLQHNPKEHAITYTPADQHPASKKRLSADPSLDMRTPKMRTVGTGQGQRGNIGGRLLQRPGSSNTYQPTVEDHSDSPTPRRRDHGISANRTNKALPPTPTPSELDRSWQSMGGSKASQGEKAASSAMNPATGLLRTPRPGSSLRRSQTVRGETDGPEDVDGPDLFADFNPPFASHTPQGPSPVAPRTARNQGGDQPTSDQTKVDRQDASEHAVPENVDDSSFIPLISSSDHGMDDNTEVPRIEYSFEEGNTTIQVPQVPALVPTVAARSTSDETGGRENKQDTSMTDAPADGDVKVKDEDRMEE